MSAPIHGGKMPTDFSDIEDICSLLLASRIPEADSCLDALSQAGLPPTGAALISMALLRKAAGGDVSAFKVIKEISEARTAEGGGEADMRSMSDAELMKLMAEEGPP